ncbi:MAG: U32 family peptidase [Treponema sp.]|nr:U32 family peptidase [Treponema sp.]
MELVSPAGNIEKLLYAYEYGADAVYIGLKKFSLRIKADNFYEDEYKKINEIKKQHPNKKLYCALNISFHNSDIEQFISDIDYFKSYPIDSFIIQDMGMVNILKKYFPNVKLHLSTQANCINKEAVKFYMNQGFSRVVLGRETSLKEVRAIKDYVPQMELEAFAHGAMCIAYSGRCLMSAYLTGRSANKGFCSHSCRWNFRSHISTKDIAKSGLLVLEEAERKGEFFPVFEGEDYTAILSSKDLCMIEHLDTMKDAGIDSLKIEGRMKSLYYCALVTRAYRKAIDSLYGKISETDAKPYIDELYKTNHREFTTGFYFNRSEANKTTRGESNSDYEMAGTISHVLTDEDTKKIFELAKNNYEQKQIEISLLHPNAIGKIENIQKEMSKFFLEPKAGYKFYSFEPLNKIYKNMKIEYVGPDILSIKDDSFILINPEDGTQMDWVCHNHKCLIYTNKKIEKNWIVRFNINSY